jgi:ArsR family transcriptional regulator, arsenate/arsenite/antimonite-responsive transcriptional repressor
MNNLFKALSDPNRRRILELLKTKDMSVKELQTYFSITQEALSHHLSVLKKADLVSDERKGQFVFYSLNTSIFEEVMNYFLSLYHKRNEN